MSQTSGALMNRRTKKKLNFHKSISAVMANHGSHELSIKHPLAKKMGEEYEEGGFFFL